MRGTKVCPQEEYRTIPMSQTFPFPVPFGHWSSPQPFTLQPIFIFPPEEASFTPVQTFQVTRVQTVGLLHVTSKAFIWQAVWKMPACYINLHFSLHPPFLISVWEHVGAKPQRLHLDFSHVRRSWASTRAWWRVTPSSCSTWKPV